MQLPDDLDLIAELDEPTPAQEAIAAALRDLDQVTTIRRLGTHYDGCWDMHADCLAARIRRTLTEEDHYV